MRQLNRETGNTILTQRNLGTTIQNALSKFGIYTSMAIACRRLFQEIKEGVQYVKYLDESLECWRTNVEIRYRKIKQNR